MRGERTLLTLEERLERSSRSQAASPEAAARLVERLAGLPAPQLFFGKSDVEAMYGLTGEFWEHPAVDIESYCGFSHSFRLAVQPDKGSFQLPLSGLSSPGLSPLRQPSPRLPSPGMSLSGNPTPYEPVWGIRANNALVLLGLMLLDHAKGRLNPKGFYHCMRMTLEQYLDALADLGLWADGNPGLAEGFRGWQDMLLKDYGGPSPLGEALAGILRRYMAAWQEFDHLDHILRCIGALSCYLEQEETGRTLPREEEGKVRRFREALCRYGSDLEGRELVEMDKRYQDPRGYYFTLAYEYPEDLPDPGGRDVAPGALRSQIFLSERDYSPETLRRLAAGSPFPDLRALLERYVSEERLASAMREINTAVAGIYILFVEPYLRMGRAGGKHLNP